MLRNVGFFLLFLIPTAIGFRKYRKLCDRNVFWENFREFLQYAETAVRYTAIPAEELIGRYESEEAKFRLTQLSRQFCSDFRSVPAAWKTAVEQVCRENAMTGEEESFLKRFGDGFGSTDLEGQLAHFRFYKERSEERRNRARKEQQEKGKLWITLGVLSGIGIVLLLW